MNKLSKNRFFSLLRDIPYENVSKILRLTNPEDVRPRDAKTLLYEHHTAGYGGTCFSLVNLCHTVLKKQGIKVYPVMADISRKTFPHIFAVIEFSNHRYLLDPGYLIHSPVGIDNKNNINFSNSVVNFRLMPNHGHFALYSMTGTQSKLRYKFTLAPLPADDFKQLWIESFSYINDITVSGIINGKFIYINGDFVQIRTTGNVEKYKNRQKAMEYLESYFHFNENTISDAYDILKKINHKKEKSDR